jgi:hypothetical protein
MGSTRTTFVSVTFVSLLSLTSTPHDLAAQDRAAVDSLLNFPVSLARHGNSGDSRTYSIRRENLTLGRQGEVLSVIAASAVIDRTLLVEIEEGVWSERMSWREFAYGQSAPGMKQPNLIPQTDLPPIEYEVDPQDRFPAGVSGPAELGPGQEGVFLSILILDAWSWDGLLHQIRNSGARTVRVGEEISLHAWDDGMHISSVACTGWVTAPSRWPDFRPVAAKTYASGSPSTPQGTS